MRCNCNVTYCRIWSSKRCCNSVAGLNDGRSTPVYALRQKVYQIRILTYAKGEFAFLPPQVDLPCNCIDGAPCVECELPTIFFLYDPVTRWLHWKGLTRQRYRQHSSRRLSDIIAEFELINKCWHWSSQWIQQSYIHMWAIDVYVYLYVYLSMTSSTHCLTGLKCLGFTCLTGWWWGILSQSASAFAFLHILS